MTAQLPMVRPDSPHTGSVLAGPARFAAGARSLPGVVPDELDTHRGLFGPRPGLGRAQLLAAVERSGLRGRGGGHVPVTTKWQAALAAGAATVVANGAESEPLSRKDAALLLTRPHLVLDGLVTAVLAIAADEGVVWLHGDPTGSGILERTVRRALAERSDPVPLRVELGPARYLSGESSAIVRALGGGAALPVHRRRPGTQPALVHNVETLARLALLTRGLAPRTALVSVTTGGAVAVLERPEGTTVAEAVELAVAARPRAVLVGGYGGTWVSWDDAHRLELGGPQLGAGVLHALTGDTSGVALTARLARYLADESAGQCGPCVFGLRAVADAMEVLAGNRRARRVPARVTAFLGEIRGRGACHHPDGAARMVASALEVLADDVDAHVRGRCLHG